MVRELTDPITVTLYGACRPTAVQHTIAVLEEHARKNLGEIVPRGALEWEGRVARRRMTEANQPEASIVAIEAFLATMPDGVLVEFAFLAERSKLEGRPDAYAAGPAGRRQ